jgi:hypothetical protein
MPNVRAQLHSHEELVRDNAERKDVGSRITLLTKSIA